MQRNGRPSVVSGRLCLGKRKHEMKAWCVEVSWAPKLTTEEDNVAVVVCKDRWDEGEGRRTRNGGWEEKRKKEEI